MGAGSSQPAHVVTVRLEAPQNVEAASTAFFASLSSDADGLSKYKNWGEPHAISLWADDIITAFIYTAKNEEQLDKGRYEEFAELHLPWELVSSRAADGQEAMFDLGLMTGVPLLGQNASAAQYREAFYRATGAAVHDPSAPRMRVRLWMGALDKQSPRGHSPPPQAAPAPAPPNPQVANPPVDDAAGPPPSARLLTPPTSHRSGGHATSKALSYGVEELGPDDMKQIFRLQLENQELRSKLSIEESEMPPVEDEVRDHVERLRQAVLYNYDIRTDLQSVEKEATITNLDLTVEQRLAVADATLSPPATASNIAEDDAEKERLAAEVMEEIQRVTQQSIGLLSNYEEQIKDLEAELIEARRVRDEQPAQPPGSNGNANQVDDPQLMQYMEAQRNNLQALERECQGLDISLNQEMERLENCEGLVMQKLKLQDEVEVEQIGHLQHLLQRQRVDSECPEPNGPLQPPGTSQLLSETERLRVDLETKQRQGSQEQDAMQTYADDLRQEAGRLEDDYRQALKDKVAAERTLEELRQVRTSSASSEREYSNELSRTDSLTTDLGRSKRRLEFLDNKVVQLEGEDKDIRQRASLVQRAPNSPRGSDSAENADGPDVVELHEIVHQRQVELQDLRRQEDMLHDEQDKAQQALEAARVEAAVLQQKMKLLQSRISAAPVPTA